MDEQRLKKPEDDYQAASRATSEDDYDDYVGQTTPRSPSRHVIRTILRICLVLVLVVVIGFGAYWFFIKKDSKAGTNKNSGNTSQQPQQTNAEDIITAETEHYASTGFMLEFDYPADWKVTETTGDGKLTVRSPSLQLEGADGRPVTGQVMLTIRNKQQALPEFDKGNAVAVRESEKIAYTKPSSVQRGSTYLSFLNYASSTAEDSLDGLYITGDIGYQKDQAIPKADFTPVDPVINVAFVKCTDSSCDGEGTATGISTSMWEKGSFAKPIKAMLQSLTIS